MNPVNNRELISSCSSSNHNFSSSSSSQSQNSASSKGISCGYGEYAVYRYNSKTKEKSPIDRALFDKVFKIFLSAQANLYSPNPSKEIINNRYDYLRQRVKELDSSLEIAFIPRTIYDLAYLKQAAKEEINEGKFCMLSNHAKRSNLYWNELDFQEVKEKAKEIQAKSIVFEYAARKLEAEGKINHEKSLVAQACGRFLKNCGQKMLEANEKKFTQNKREIYLQGDCWHMGHNVWPRNDLTVTSLYERAYAFNSVLVDKYLKNTGFLLSSSDIDGIFSDLVEYFQRFYALSCKSYEYRIISHDSMNTPETRAVESMVQRSVERSALTGFTYQNKVFRLFDFKSIGIRSGEEKVLKKVVDLECAPESSTSTIIYRGGSLADSTITRSNKKDHSLSFGTGLFASSLSGDFGAVPWHYISKSASLGYAIRVPYSELSSSPFYRPPSHAISQLNLYGDLHPRTKVQNPDGVTSGIHLTNLSYFRYVKELKMPAELTSQRTSQDREKTWQQYFNKRVDLTQR